MLPAKGRREVTVGRFGNGEAGFLSPVTHLQTAARGEQVVGGDPPGSQAGAQLGFESVENDAGIFVLSECLGGEGDGSRQANPEGAEHAGMWGAENPGHAKLAGNRAGVLTARPAEGHEGVRAQIVTP